jgi:hypothetical protein
MSRGRWRGCRSNCDASLIDGAVLDRGDKGQSEIMFGIRNEPGIGCLACRADRSIYTLTDRCVYTLPPLSLTARADRLTLRCSGQIPGIRPGFAAELKFR